MKKMKLGTLGVSNLYLNKVIPALLSSEVIENYGIASRDGAKAKEASVKYGIPKAYSSYEELLQDNTIDMIYIPLPNHMHLEWIKKSADYGKHIICEKPIALNAPQAQEAMDYASQKGVRLMEAFMYRFHPQWRKALELVKFREIGKISTIHTYFSYFNNDPKNIRNIKEIGGGVLLDIGCYAVSSARFLLQGEPLKAVCRYEIDPNFQTDILANGMLDFGEVRTLFTVGTQTFPHQKVQVYGTGGIITIEIPFNIYPDLPAKVMIQNNVGTRTLELGPADQYQLEFEEFALAIQNGNETPTPPKDAVQNMKVLDALFKSAQSGRWENV